MYYSEDLRTKALSLLDQGKSKVSVSQLLGISRRVLYNWLKQKQEKGHLKPKKRVEKPYKIDEKGLRVLIKEHPDMYQKDIGKKLNVTQAAICRIFKRLGITRKKRTSSILSAQKKRG